MADEPMKAQLIEPTKAQLAEALETLLDALDRMQTPISLSQRVEEARAVARKLVPKVEPPVDPADVATRKDEGLRSVE